jgi:hypothetical protein
MLRAAGPPGRSRSRVGLGARGSRARAAAVVMVVVIRVALDHRVVGRAQVVRSRALQVVREAQAAASRVRQMAGGPQAVASRGLQVVGGAQAVASRGLQVAGRAQAVQGPSLQVVGGAQVVGSHGPQVGERARAAGVERAVAVERTAGVERAVTAVTCSPGPRHGAGWRAGAQAGSTKMIRRTGAGGATALEVGRARLSPARSMTWASRPAARPDASLISLRWTRCAAARLPQSIEAASTRPPGNASRSPAVHARCPIPVRRWGRCSGKPKRSE